MNYIFILFIYYLLFLKIVLITVFLNSYKRQGKVNVSISGACQELLVAAPLCSLSAQVPQAGPLSQWNGFRNFPAAGIFKLHITSSLGRSVRFFVQWPLELEEIPAKCTTLRYGEPPQQADFRTSDPSVTASTDTPFLRRNDRSQTLKLVTEEVRYCFKACHNWCPEVNIVSAPVTFIMSVHIYCFYYSWQNYPV